MEQENYIPDDFSIEALQNGSEQAFKAVFRQYYKALCYFSERIVKNSQAAEDIATETLPLFRLFRRATRTIENKFLNLLEAH